VWNALTNGDFTERYWGGRRIESDWHVGSPVRHLRSDGGVDWEGEVLQAEPPHALAYTFQLQVSAGTRRERPSRVTFELEAIGDVVKLTLTHDTLEPGSATFEKTRHGWPAIMSSLKSLLETGSPLPFSGLGFAPANRKRGFGTL
jgi:uncharacterized protein YndB with AHSA1/START domain